MRFSEYLQQAWAEHNTDTQKVADGFIEAFPRIEQASDIGQLAGLITHVLGQHLGRWDDALKLLKSLKQHSQFTAGSEADGAVTRSMAALQLASNQIEDLGELPAGDQTRVYALTAAILSERDTARAREFLITALSLAKSVVEKSDPGLKSLAASTHNIAAALEVKKTLTAEEVQLMLEAAAASRKYWEIVGTWVEVKQAEYRLALTHAKAGKFEEAIAHAREGLRICEENKGSALEYFFAYECIALVEKARGFVGAFQDASKKARGHFHQLTVEDKKYCEESMKSLAK